VSSQSVELEMLPGRPNGWLRLASKALARLVRCEPSTGTPAKEEPSPTAPQPIVGVRKSAVCKDAHGQLRRIDLFLPADLMGELARPLDIKFLDGDQPVTAEHLCQAIRSNFANKGANS
jgi:hypothetical protein